MDTLATRPLLVHHMANRGHHHPPNSQSALRYCLEAGARVVEVDINALRDGDFLLLHDDELDGTTDGQGRVGDITAEEARSLHYRWPRAPGEPLALLSEALSLVRGYPHFQELQLDLKVSPALTTLTLQRLVHRLQPVRPVVRVTSGADWALRQLQAWDSELPLGFDPLLYLEIEDPGQGIPPQRRGAYGYWDDHPLAVRRWGATADYLAARAEALWVQAPAGAVWYIRGALLARALEDGFDWIAFLHARSALVDAWTLDVDEPGHLELARRLVAAGVDRITTNDAPRLAEALGGGALL